MKSFDTNNLTETRIGGKTVYDGHIIKMCLDDVRLPDGKTARREYVKHRGGAAVLAVDGDGFAYVVKQFRYAYGKVLTEIPAGKLEEGEPAIVTAARELEEETGFIAENIKPYGVLYPTPGYTNELLHIFLATNLKKSKAHLDDGEFLQAEKIKITDLLNKVLSGEIHDAKTCYAVLRYARENNLS